MRIDGETFWSASKIFPGTPSLAFTKATFSTLFAALLLMSPLHFFHLAVHQQREAKRPRRRRRQRPRPTRRARPLASGRSGSPAPAEGRRLRRAQEAAAPLRSSKRPAATGQSSQHVTRASSFLDGSLANHFRDSHSRRVRDVQFRSSVGVCPPLLSDIDEEQRRFLLGNHS